MTLNLSLPQTPPELRPRIVVFGVGGAGCNAVNNMLNSDIEGVECVVANTDAQSLNQSECDKQIQLGLNITQGLGAGSRPEIGRAAAEEEIDQIVQNLNGSHMVFITAGMGGGTGTGAAPVIARAAREHGILTVGVVTKPFHFEGSQRMRLAEAGLQELQDVVDTLIVIPNQNLFRVANESTTFADAFRMADEVLHSGVRGITDLMVMPGLINLDFADIRTVMSEMGKAMMGAGEADGEGRAIKASESAIANPLLDDVSMKGARGLLINISGGPDLTLYEVDEAANRVRDEVDPSASIIFGSTFDPSLQGKIRVSVFATGIDTPMSVGQRSTEVKILKPAEAHEIQEDPLVDQVATYQQETADATLLTRNGDQESALDQISAGHEDAAWEAQRTATEEEAAAIAQSEMFEQQQAQAAEEAAALAAQQTAYQEIAADAAAGIETAPAETAPVTRPTGLAQKVQGAAPTYAATPAPAQAAPAYAAPTQAAPVRATPELRPDSRPEHGAAADMSAQPDDGAGKRDSMFSFLRNRRKEAAGSRGAADQRTADDDKESSPGTRHQETADEGAATASKVRVITSADRTRRETTERPARTAQQTAPASPKTDQSKEDDLLEIPAFLRRQAN